MLEVSRNKQTLQIAMEEIIKKDEYDIGAYEQNISVYRTAIL